MSEPVNRDALFRMFPGWVASKYSQAMIGGRIRGKAVVSRCAMCTDEPCAGIGVVQPYVVRKDSVSGVFWWR